MDERPGLLLRADASPAAGGGHVMRLLALGQAALAAGVRTAFALAEGVEAFGPRIRAEGLELVPVAARPGTPEDAAATAAVAGERGLAWVALDGYPLGETYRRPLAERGLRLLVVDDWGQAGGAYARVIVDQNVAARAADYPQRPASCELLLGTRYALLRREFLAPVPDRERAARAQGEVRVLVTLGASDPPNLTGKVIEALTGADLGRWQARVVVGPANPHARALATWKDDRIELLYGPGDMAALLRWADLAVTGGGSTLWELAYVGVPALVIPVADNQVPNARRLAELNAAAALGWHAELTAGEIALALERLVREPARLRQLAQAGRTLVDGRGSERVLSRLGLGQPRATGRGASAAHD